MMPIIFPLIAFLFLLAYFVYEGKVLAKSKADAKSFMDEAAKKDKL